MTDVATSSSAAAASRESSINKVNHGHHGHLLVQPKLELLDTETDAAEYEEDEGACELPDDDDDEEAINYESEPEALMNAAADDGDDADYDPSADAKTTSRRFGKTSKSSKLLQNGTAFKRTAGPPSSSSKRAMGAKFGLSLFGKRGLGKPFANHDDDEDEDEDDEEEDHKYLGRKYPGGKAAASSQFELAGSTGKVSSSSSHQHHDQDSSTDSLDSFKKPAVSAETYLIDRYKYAVRHIRQGLSVEEACNKYRISKGALLKCLSGGTAPRGKKTRMTESEEDEVVRWLISHKSLRYNDAIHLVFERVNQIFERTHRPNPFHNGRPSMDWWYDFLSRHPQIMASKPEWLKRGKVNDQYLKDVQSGKLKCTKFRRALLSAIQYMRSMSDPSAALLKESPDEIEMTPTTPVYSGVGSKTKFSGGGKVDEPSKKRRKQARKCDNKENEAAKPAAKMRKNATPADATGVRSYKRARRSVSTSSTCSLLSSSSTSSSSSSSAASSIFSAAWSKNSTKQALEAGVLSGEMEDYEQFLRLTIDETAAEFCDELKALGVLESQFGELMANLMSEMSGGGQVRQNDAPCGEGSENLTSFKMVDHLLTSAGEKRCHLSASISGSDLSDTTPVVAKSRTCAKSLKRKLELVNDHARISELTINMYDYVDYDEDNRMFLVKNQDDTEHPEASRHHHDDDLVDHAAADDHHNAIIVNVVNETDKCAATDDQEVTDACHGRASCDADYELEEEEGYEEEEDDGRTNITTLHEFI